MKKKAVRYNIVDLVAAVLIVAVALFAFWKLVIDREVEHTKTVTMRYSVLAEGVAADIYEGVQAHLPSQLMASGVRLNGEIKSVKKRPHLELSSDGKWVEDPNHVNLIFEVENLTQAGEVLLSKVGEQEVRVGRKDYTLKSEYIEFHNTIILNVEWVGWEK